MIAGTGENVFRVLAETFRANHGQGKDFELDARAQTATFF